MPDLDLDAMERWSRETMRRDTTKLMEEFLGSHVRERLENEAKLATGDNLALIARVRELEEAAKGEWGQYNFGRNTERKRCAEIARATMVSPDSTRPGKDGVRNMVCEAIAAAIERGDA